MKISTLILVLDILAAPCSAAFKCTEVMDDPDNAIMPTMITCTKTVKGIPDPSVPPFFVLNSNPMSPGSTLAKAGDVKVDMRVRMDGSFVEPEAVRRAIKRAYEKARAQKKAKPQNRIIEVGE